ncbi:MAG TPA: SgcJ/EcaC family oxidoreductase [Pyrinomonadaceae bacterium]
MNTHTRSVRIITLVTALAIALGASALAATARATDSSDEAAIRDNVRQLETGWNRKSGALFAKPFAEDADYVVINGMHIRGREAIDKGHQHIFDTIYKETTLSLSVERIRHLRPDVALVHVHARATTPHPEGPREKEGRLTLVMSKEKEGWKIAAFQNTEVVKNQ